MGTGRLCVEAFGDGESGAGAVGSNPQLDALYVACDAGDLEACDDLYFDSPLDSAYEAFGDTCGGRQAMGTGQLCVELA